MDTVIYFLLALFYFILLVIGIRLANKDGWLKVGNVLLIVVLALLYDNGVLAIGKFVGEGNLLITLNKMRFWFHAFFTPLLVLFAWNTLVKADIKWAKRTITKSLVVIFTLFLIIIEVVSVTWGISLEPSWKNGILSYKKVGGSGFPPIMIVGVSGMLFITSIIIWWKQKWPWYFLGILSMGLIPIVHFFIKTGALHNLGELTLMMALLATKSHQDK